MVNLLWVPGIAHVTMVMESRPAQDQSKALTEF
jgi:hypothetical protein